MKHRRCLPLFALPAALLAFLFGARTWVNANGNVLRAGQGSLFSMPLKVGVTGDFAYTLTNVSSRTVVLNSVSLPAGISNHILVLRVSIGRSQSVHFFGEYGWPPGTKDAAGKPVQWPSPQVRPISRFRLGKGQSATVVVTFRATAPGAYLLDPLRIHASLPVLSAWIPLTVTNTEGRLACVDLTGAACESARRLAGGM
jgi:hypothetical protein